MTIYSLRTVYYVRLYTVSPLVLGGWLEACGLMKSLSFNTPGSVIEVILGLLENWSARRRGCRKEGCGEYLRRFSIMRTAWRRILAWNCDLLIPVYSRSGHNLPLLGSAAVACSDVEKRSMYRSRQGSCRSWDIKGFQGLLKPADIVWDMFAI